MGNIGDCRPGKGITMRNRRSKSLLAVALAVSLGGALAATTILSGMYGSPATSSALASPGRRGLSGIDQGSLPTDAVVGDTVRVRHRGRSRCDHVAIGRHR